MSGDVMLRTDALAKSFTLHLQGGVRIPVGGWSLGKLRVTIIPLLGGRRHLVAKHLFREP